MVRIIAALLVLLLNACDRPTIDDKTMQQLDKTVQDTLRMVDGQTKDLSNATQNELNKLVQYEYHLEDFAPELSADAMQSRLAQLGTDRWECFDVELLNNKVRIFCKRHPQTPLRYIPRWFPG